MLKVAVNHLISPSVTPPAPPRPRPRLTPCWPCAPAGRPYSGSEDTKKQVNVTGARRSTLELNHCIINLFFTLVSNYIQHDARRVHEGLENVCEKYFSISSTEELLRTVPNPWFAQSSCPEEYEKVTNMKYALYVDVQLLPKLKVVGQRTRRTFSLMPLPTAVGPFF